MAALKLKEELQRKPERIGILMNKFLNYMKRMIKAVVKYIGDNWQRLVQFLDLEPQVYFNNNPRW